MKMITPVAAIPLALLLSMDAAQATLEIPECDPPPIQGNQDWVIVDDDPDEADRSCEMKITVDPLPSGKQHAFFLETLDANVSAVDYVFLLDAKNIALAERDNWTFFALSFDDAVLTLSLIKNSFIGNSAWAVEYIWSVNGKPVRVRTITLKSLVEPVAVTWTQGGSGQALIEVEVGAPFQDLVTYRSGDPNAVAWGLINDLSDPVAGAEIIFVDLVENQE